MPGRLDRYGDPIEDELLMDEGRPSRPHRCRDGWLDDDAEGRPTPCPICKAPTVKRIHAQRSRDYLEPPRPA
jgi:hypothetical protein